MSVDPSSLIRSTDDDPTRPPIEPLLRPVMIRRRWVRAGVVDPQHVIPDGESVRHGRRAA
jgi:hypothetical protein